MNFVEAMTAAQAGYDTWAAKPHNAKWAKMIYHTPIPNDLLVNIATEIAAATRAADKKVEGWDAIADDMEALQVVAQGRALAGERLIPWAIKTLSEMQPPAGETIRTTQDGSMEAAPETGQSPVGAASTEDFGRPVPRTFYDFADDEDVKP